MTWLGHDHHGFEVTVYKCRVLCDRDDFEALGKTFRDFRGAYEVHLRMEEEGLFPSYESREGVPLQPTEALRADHIQISRLLKCIENRIAHRDGRAAEDLSLLYRVLCAHHEKEEHIFLPMASELLAEKKEVVLAALGGVRAG